MRQELGREEAFRRKTQLSAYGLRRQHRQWPVYPSVSFPYLPQDPLDVRSAFWKGFEGSDSVYMLAGGDEVREVRTLGEATCACPVSMSFD